MIWLAATYSASILTNHCNKSGVICLAATYLAASKVFEEISFRKNFAKLATKRFSCFAKMRDEFREFCSFETAEITKETSFAKHKNRENEENLK